MDDAVMSGQTESHRSFHVLISVSSFYGHPQGYREGAQDAAHEILISQLSRAARSKSQ